MKYRLRSYAGVIRVVELYLFNFLRKCQTDFTLCSDLHQNPLLLKFKQSISRNCILDK